jgi:hypothetical protein
MSGDPGSLSDDTPFWRAWMASEDAPLTTAAHVTGVFEVLESGPMTVVDLATVLQLSNRASRALLGHSAALGLLTQVDEHFGLASVTKAFLSRTRTSPWPGVLESFLAHPVTADNYLAGLAVRDERFPAGPRSVEIDGHLVDDGALHVIIEAAHLLPMAVVADQLGVAERLGSSPVGNRRSRFLDRAVPGGDKIARPGPDDGSGHG